MQNGLENVQNRLRSGEAAVAHRDGDQINAFSDHSPFFYLPPARRPVAAGQLHSCAVQSNGKLVCFGALDAGQCEAPPTIGRVTAVASGWKHTCAVLHDGKLVCFGANDSGQCKVPRGLGPITAVAAGWKHTCAVQADGKLACFGANDAGQCDVPAGLGPVIAVAAGCCVKNQHH